MIAAPPTSDVTSKHERRGGRQLPRKSITDEQRSAEIHNRSRQKNSTAWDHAVQLGLFVAENRPIGNDIAWSPIFSAVCALPATRITDDQLEKGSWVRRDGNTSLHITSPHGAEGIPYGKAARMALIWLATTIKRNPNLIQDGQLQIETNFHSFCNAFGITSGGGPKSLAHSILEQWRRLLSSHFTFVTTGENNKTSYSHISIASHAIVASECTTARRWTEIFRTGVEVSPGFIREIQDRTFPLDDRVMQQLWKSRGVLMIDLYCWLCRRVYLARRRNRDAYVPWEELRAQTGSTNTDTYAWRRDVRNTLVKLEPLWHGLSYDTSHSKYLVIHKRTPLPVPPAEKRLEVAQ